MKKQSQIINRKFYSRNTLKVARDLLGCFLVRQYRGKIIRAMITETEAYHGEKDLACHASKGRTPRTEVMYGNSGHAYVYMIYGMYHCLNVVTEKKDFPAAVLIRGLANVERIEANRSEYFRGRSALLTGRQSDLLNISTWKPSFQVLNGPGKLCKFLKIDRKLNKWDLTKGERLWIESPAQNPAKRDIVAGRRIGIDYAQHCREYLWRYSISLSDNPKAKL